MAVMRIDRIVVGERYRKDLGDLIELQRSIAEEGLLHPVVVTEDRRLIAGQRRLEACRALGWTEVSVHVVDNQDDAVGLLRKERDENVCRKDMTVEEKINLAQRVEELERPRAEERMANGRRRGGQAAGSGEPPAKKREVNPTAAAAAASVGMSTAHYKRARYIVRTASDPDAPAEVRESARQALDEVNAGKTTVTSAEKRVRQVAAPSKKKSVREAPKQKPDVSGPASKKRDGETVAARYIKVAELAEQGYSSEQIANKLGYAGAHIVRKIARDEDIEIPADKSLRKTRRKVDHQRIVEQTVSGLEGTRMSLDLLDVTQIEDLSEIDYWITSLTESVKSLRTLSRQLSDLALNEGEDQP